ncbi:MAG TPA: diguanylate cyclase [Candidatus Ozemobacteraceae bacterium]|nr:diguanylate cyclase [Candidatus Ozemobacteraceae bacterium]
MAENSIKRAVPFLHSIKVKTWAGIFLLSVIPLAILGLYSFSFLTQITKDLLIKGNLQASQQVKNEVDQYFQMYDDLIRFLKSDARLALPRSPQAAEALRQMDQGYEFIDRIVICASDGTILAHSGKADTPPSPLTDLERRALTMPESQLFTPGMFFIRTPLTPDGSTLLASISFLKLRKTLEGMVFGTSFTFYLVTREGQNILDQKDFPQEFINSLIRLSFGGYDLYDGGGDAPSRVAVLLPILRHGLRLIVIQDAVEVYSLMQRVKRNIDIVIAIVGIVAFGFGTYFSIRLTSPIITIADKANEISGGNLRVNVHSNRRDEIGFLASCFNNMTVRIRKKVFELTALFKISQIINTASSHHQALDESLSYIVTTFLAKRGSIMLFSDLEDQLKLKSVRLFGELEPGAASEMREKIVLRPGKGIAGMVLASGKPIVCRDCAGDDRFKKYEADAGVETPLFLCTVPLIVQGKTIGVINLADRSDPENFGDADLELLMAIANQLAVSIENAKLHELAITDGLTGLFIHRYFQIKLDDEMKAARRYDTPLSLIIFDIDHFKKFNDTFGHQQGDRVLKETARLVKESVRGTDLACRYGGEEFALILPHTTAEQAMIFAERLRKRIAANEMRCEETKMQVTISIGIAEFPRMASDKTSLIKKADQALYSCKNKGRNCVQIFSDDMA